MTELDYIKKLSSFGYLQISFFNRVSLNFGGEHVISEAQPWDMEFDLLRALMSVYYQTIPKLDAAIIEAEKHLNKTEKNTESELYSAKSSLESLIDFRDKIK